ncbi:MAG TPA: flagellar biosynthesis anti-sigma factor FlgM [Edaphobacter sp.]
MSYPNAIGDWTQSMSTVVTSTATESRPYKNLSETVFSSPSATQDKTNLSSTSELVARALEGSDVRFDKVNTLRESIANGSYYVSSSDLAEKMLQ